MKMTVPLNTKSYIFIQNMLPRTRYKAGIDTYKRHTGKTVFEHEMLVTSLKDRDEMNKNLKNQKY